MSFHLSDHSFSPGCRYLPQLPAVSCVNTPDWERICDMRQIHATSAHNAQLGDGGVAVEGELSVLARHDILGGRVNNVRVVSEVPRIFL